MLIFFFADEILMLPHSIFPNSPIMNSLLCLETELHKEINQSSRKLYFNHILLKLNLYTNQENQTVIDCLNTNNGKLFVKAIILKLMISSNLVLNE